MDRMPKAVEIDDGIAGTPEHIAYWLPAIQLGTMQKSPKEFEQQTT